MQSIAQGVYEYQPEVKARTVNILNIDNKQFKDLNKSLTLDIYEDWRQPVSNRIDDLLMQMDLLEKVGMLLINTLNSGSNGQLTQKAIEFVEDEKMTRFIFRNLITDNPDRSFSHPREGVHITPFETAQFMNAMQELAESTRLGIPVVFKSNARNHLENSAKAGINVSSGSFSSWPKEAGLAATRDMELIKEFANTMRQEWVSIGLRGMYGYVADLSTEPRWYRIHETFTEDADLASDIITTLVSNLQGKSLNSKSVALTIKHFPGGGPQENGADPHYSFGKNQAYPSNNFDYHLKPFIAAIDAGASSIMAYYGVPVGQAYEPNNVGMAFSKAILTRLLRENLGFQGYINSDTGIIGNRAWGLEDKDLEEQILIAIEAGTDVLSGFNDNDVILNLVNSGRLSERRVNQSVRRLLKEQFELGLFENPYVNANRASYLVGNPSFQRKADIAQRKSIVVLQNKMILPLSPFDEDDTLKIFTIGINVESFDNTKWSSFEFISGDQNESGILTEIPKDADYAILRISVTNEGSHPDLIFGGANPDELNLISFTEMANAKSWKITPSLEKIKGVMKELGNEKIILSINFRQPFVIDRQCDFLKAGGILATFGVSDEALMDIVTGRFSPSGKLPFALANKLAAITNQQSDAPGYLDDDTLFPFGHGLKYDK
ncbi:MAG: glycoside hydrolase family 3 C-terminal domain-containing protein [Cyclobacteriaceae bacterium]|nr:glycoside hydrolase family 3 C-terminal domain-containing protein [Cyclobacteriaceae bacterium]